MNRALKIGLVVLVVFAAIAVAVISRRGNERTSETDRKPGAAGPMNASVSPVPVDRYTGAGSGPETGHSGDTPFIREGKPVPSDIPGDAAEATGESASTNAPDGPPMEPDLPPSLSAQILNLVHRAENEAGPEASAMGLQLMDSDSPLLRAAGAAILSKTGDLDNNLLKRIAADRSNSVPLNVLGWLSDTGQWEAHDNLLGLLAARGLTLDQLQDALSGDQLTPSGLQKVIEIARDELNSAESHELVDSVASDPDSDYLVWMKSLYLLRDGLTFQQFKSSVADKVAKLPPEELDKQKGGKAFLDKQEGPEFLFNGPRTFVPSDVEELLANDDDTMRLANLVARMYDLAAHTNSAYVPVGTTDYVRENLKPFDDLPLTSEQQRYLDEARALTSKIEPLETDNRPPANLPSPPPDAD